MLIGFMFTIGFEVSGRMCAVWRINRKWHSQNFRPAKMKWNDGAILRKKPNQMRDEEEKEENKKKSNLKCVKTQLAKENWRWPLWRQFNGNSEQKPTSNTFTHDEVWRSNKFTFCSVIQSVVKQGKNYNLNCSLNPFSLSFIVLSLSFSSILSAFHLWQMCGSSTVILFFVFWFFVVILFSL